MIKLIMKERSNYTHKKINKLKLKIITINKKKNNFQLIILNRK